MSRPWRSWVCLPVVVVFALVLRLAVAPVHAQAPAAPGDDMEEEADFDPWVEGNQEIQFFREQLMAGNVPQPGTITAEAILNRHVLPIGNTLGCSGSLCLAGAVAEGDLLTRPDLLYLGGFSLFTPIKTEEWKRPAVNVVAVVNMSGARQGETQALVRDSLRLLIGQLRKGDQISIVVRGTQARIHLRPSPVGFLNKGPMYRAAKTVELVTGGADDAIRAGYDLARSSAAGFEGGTRVVVFTDQQPDLQSVGANSFRVAIDEGAAAGIGLSMIGLGVKFSSDMAARVASTRGCTIRSFSNGDDLRTLFRESYEEIVTDIAHDVEVVVTPRRGLRIEGVYGMPRYLMSWDGTGRGVRVRLGALFRSARSKVFFVTLASEHGDLAETPAAPGDGPPLKVRFRFRPVLAGETGGAEQAFDVPVVPLMASGGLRTGAALLSEYLALREASREYLLDNNADQARALLRDAAAMLATETDATVDAEKQLVQQFTDALTVSAGRAVQADDADLTGGRRSRSRAPQQALWGAWFAESSTDEARVGDTYCFFPGGSMILFPALDEEEDSTGRPVQLRTYSLWSGILRMDERKESWDWSVVDDQLFLEGRGPLRGVDLTLKRVPMPAAAEGRKG